MQRFIWFDYLPDRLARCARDIDRVKTAFAYSHFNLLLVTVYAPSLFTRPVLPLPPTPSLLEIIPLMEPKVSEEQQEEIVRKSKAYENDDIGDLRKHSRRAYLDKRKEKLLEIEDEIRDHEYIFEGVKLTEAEERELRYKKEIYELAKKNWEEDNEDEYKMPGVYDIDVGIHQEERFSVATQHYRYFANKIQPSQAVVFCNKLSRDAYYTCERQQRKCHVGKGSRHCELLSLVVRKVSDFLCSLLHFFSEKERKEGEQQLLG